VKVENIIRRRSGKIYWTPSPYFTEFPEKSNGT
jgi:hypothetical protein